MTAAMVECDNNDMVASTIDTVVQPACGSSVSWRDDMVSRRQIRKRRERVEQGNRSDTRPTPTNKNGFSATVRGQKTDVVQKS